MSEATFPADESVHNLWPMYGWPLILGIYDSDRTASKFRENNRHSARCLVETAHSMWNITASLLPPVSSASVGESIALIASERLDFIPPAADCRVIWLVVRPCSGTNVHVLESVHPENVETVSATCCSTADCTAFCLILQWIPGNLIERLRSISFGFTIPWQLGVELGDHVPSLPQRLKEGPLIL